MKLFKKICSMTQPALKMWLLERYTGYGFEVICEDGFLHLIPSDKDKTIPVCLTAHMDTVHKEKMKKMFVEKHESQTILTSPQGIGGDDRCGVFMIVKLLDLGYKPYVVFCEDEESGCIGASKFAKTDYAKEMDIKFMIELDRRGSNDAVYYDLDNEEFEKFVTEVTGYTTASGSYSDICEIAPTAKVAAVNLSCGYYKEHTLEHYVVWEEMMNTLEATAHLLDISINESTPVFEYKKNYMSKFYDWDYGYGYGDGRYRYFTVTYVENSKLNIDYAEGYSEEEAIGRFLMDHPTLCCADIAWEED